MPGEEAFCQASLDTTIMADSSSDVSSEDATLQLNKDEILFLQASFARAVASVDVGAEVIKRLLNDKRSLFKALLETQCGEIAEIELFSVHDINTRFPRAKEVGEGVVRFFTRVISALSDPIASNRIREMSIQLGILHYRMRVWFQAENWLCVKNSLLEVVVDLVDFKSCGLRSLLFRCSGESQISSWMDKNAQRRTWTKLIQFVIRNMKRGFLSQALRSERTPENSLSSSQ